MKQINIVQAYNDLKQLANVEGYQEKEQWKLYQLRKKLKPHIDFQQERERIIYDKYREYADQDGMIKGQKYIDLMQEKEDLNNMEIDLSVEKISLPLVKGINFITIEALEDFIDFTL